MKYFDASVTFYEICLNRLNHQDMYDKESGKGPIKRRIHKIHSKKVAAVLNKTIKTHDQTLKEYGRLGLVHRCNIQPFDQNNTNITEYASSGAVYSTNITKNLIWYKDLGPRNVHSENAVRVRIANNYNADNLCFGGQQKVNISSSLSWPIIIY